MRRKRRRKGAVMFQLEDGTTFRIARITIYKFPQPPPARPWKLPYPTLSKARRRRPWSS